MPTSLSISSPVQAKPVGLWEIKRRLFAQYGPQHWWPAKTRFEVIVGAYLTQNTAWRNVELAIANLRKAGLLSVAAFGSANLRSLERLIRPSGYYRQKAANLKAFVRHLNASHSGSLDRMFKTPTPRLRHELLSLPGVGPETADCILLYAGKRPVFVVDVYTRRLLSRHGMIQESASYAEIQSLVEKQFVATSGLDAEELTQHLNEFHALIVEVGKQHCGRQAQCEGCPLQEYLPPDGFGTTL